MTSFIPSFSSPHAHRTLLCKGRAIAYTQQVFLYPQLPVMQVSRWQHEGRGSTAFLLTVTCNNSTHHSVGNPKSFLIQTGSISHKQKNASKEGHRLQEGPAAQQRSQLKDRPVTDHFLCITLQLYQVSQSSIISTDGNMDNKVKARWLHHTALTLLPISSRLFPGLLLLSLMEGERSRFLIRLVIVDPSTDIISRCHGGAHPTHGLCLGNEPRFEAETPMCSALLPHIHISLSDSARELHSCYTAKLFTEAGRLSFCRFQRIKSAVI